MLSKVMLSHMYVFLWFFFISLHSNTLSAQSPQLLKTLFEDSVNLIVELSDPSPTVEKADNDDETDDEDELDYTTEFIKEDAGETRLIISLVFCLLHARSSLCVSFAFWRTMPYASHSFGKLAFHPLSTQIWWPKTNGYFTLAICIACWSRTFIYTTIGVTLCPHRILACVHSCFPVYRLMYLFVVSCTRICLNCVCHCSIVLLTSTNRSVIHIILHNSIRAWYVCWRNAIYPLHAYCSMFQPESYACLSNQATWSLSALLIIPSPGWVVTHIVLFNGVQLVLFAKFCFLFAFSLFPSFLVSIIGVCSCRFSIVLVSMCFASNTSTPCLFENLCLVSFSLSTI